MKILTDILHTNIWTLKKTNKLIGEHHLLMYVGLIYGPLLWAMLYLASNLPLFGGMIEFLAYALVFSNYFYLINRATAGYSTNWQDVKDGFGAYMRKIFGLLFVFWVANYGVTLFVFPLLGPLMGNLLGILIYGGCFIIFNALPETIYKKDFGEIDSIRYGIDFLKGNWIDWFVPNGLLIGANIGIWVGIFKGLPIVFGTLPFAVASALTIVVAILVLQLTVGYTMLYRGLLFTRLDSTTRQKRLMQIKP